MNTQTMELAAELLAAYGYKGNEILSHPVTGYAATAQEWAEGTMEIAQVSNLSSEGEASPAELFGILEDITEKVTNGEICVCDDGLVVINK